jgi:deoxyribonuclease V
MVFPEGWPPSEPELVAAQEALGGASPERWRPSARSVVGAVFVCFARGVSGPGAAGDPAWAAAISPAVECVVEGTAGAPYEPGLLALREGPLLELAVRDLERAPDVVLVDATGRDHPRRAGLALHLGAVLDLPTVGVTHRPLVATGAWPPDDDGATAPLHLDGEGVGYWLRTRRGTRPLAVHAAWRTDPTTAVEVVTGALSGRRTPEPLRRARTLARTARARA